MSTTIREQVVAEQAKDPATVNMSQPVRMHLVSLYRQLYGNADELEGFFSSNRMRPTLSVRAAVMLLQRLHVCDTVRMQETWASSADAVIIIRACVSADDMSNKAFELSIELLTAMIAEKRSVLQARALAFSLARSEERAMHVVTHEDLIERLAELYEHDTSPGPSRSSDADLSNLHLLAERFFSDPLANPWPNADAWLALARQVEAVFEMVYRCLAHDDVRFYAWLTSKRRMNSWTRMDNLMRCHVARECRARLRFNEAIDLMDIESRLHEQMRTLRQEFLKEERRNARDDRRRRFDSLRATCETPHVPKSWKEVLRLYGLLFPKKKEHWLKDFSQTRRWRRRCR